MLLIEFFRRCYRRQRKLFYFFLIWFVLQVAFNFIKLEITPLFLYGMYSAKVQPADLYRFTSIQINGTRLDSLDLSLRERMLLETSLENYLSMRENNNTDPVKTRVESRYPFFTKLPVYGFVSHKIYNRPKDVQQFQSWFKLKCGELLKTSIDSVVVEDKYYRLEQGPSLRAVKTVALARF